MNEQVSSADALVVYENLLDTLSIRVPSTHTVLVTGEPPAIHGYSRKFTRQFAAVVTCHQEIVHKNRILRQQGQPWHLGVRRMNHNSVSWDYDSLSESPKTPKQPLVSILVSDKRHTPMHRRRLKFAKMLVGELGDRARLFGRGFEEVDDKYSALSPYEYAVVLENDIVPHYLTEKLTDALLARCLPIYVGCPNASQYLVPESFISLGLKNLDHSVDRVCQILREGRYAAHETAIELARKQVLTELNVFALLTNVLNGLTESAAPAEVTLQPQLPNPMMRLKRFLFHR